MTQTRLVASMLATSYRAYEFLMNKQFIIYPAQCNNYLQVGKGDNYVCTLHTILEYLLFTCS